MKNILIHYYKETRIHHQMHVRVFAWISTLRSNMSLLLAPWESSSLISSQLTVNFQNENLNNKLLRRDYESPDWSSDDWLSEKCDCITSAFGIWEMFAILWYKNVHFFLYFFGQTNRIAQATLLVKPHSSLIIYIYLLGRF